MTDQETLYLLSESRQNLGQIEVLVRKIARYDPGIAKVAVPTLRRLEARQNRLERKASSAQQQQLGLFITPIIVGGMALLGLGGWVFKQHEETSLERYKLESIDKCIDENIGAGMERSEASRICRELFSGRDLSKVFSELSKTIMIAGSVIAGVYIVLRWKK